MYLQSDNSPIVTVLLSGIAVCSLLHYPFERHPSTHMVDSTQQGGTLICLASFMATLHKLGSFGRGNLSWENVPNRLPCIFLADDWCGGTAHCRLGANMGWCSWVLREQAKKARRSKPGSSTSIASASAPLFRFLPWLHWMRGQMK